MLPVALGLFMNKINIHSHLFYNITSQRAITKKSSKLNLQSTYVYFYDNWEEMM